MTYYKRADDYTDDYQTPGWVLESLIPFLPRSGVIWEPCSGKGKIVTRLTEEGFDCLGTDIKTGKDCLNWAPDDFSCIVTNPPYSVKNQVIERCYRLGRPFALLLPVSALESKKRQVLYSKYGLQLLVPDKRVKFERGDGNEKQPQPNFLSVWFCWKLPLPRDIYFAGEY